MANELRGAVLMKQGRSATSACALAHAVCTRPARPATLAHCQHYSNRKNKLVSNTNILRGLGTQNVFRLAVVVLRGETDIQPKGKDIKIADDEGERHQ